MTKRLLLAAFAIVAFVSTLLAGCVPLVVGGAVAGTALVATDRRSVGAQADDEAIELEGKHFRRDIGWRELARV